MRGYVQNVGTQAVFILQRQVPPGSRIKLEDAYKAVGKRSGLKPTQVVAFVDFLRTQILHQGNWAFFEDEGKAFKQKTVVKVEKVEEKSEEVAQEVSQEVEAPQKPSPKPQSPARGAGKPLRRSPEDALSGGVTPAAILEAPYEQARALIDKTRSKMVLRRALKLTQHFSGKEQHMRHIIKRLERVY